MSQAKPEIEFHYSDEADVLFIGLGSAEPSIAEEVDDLLLVERGMFTHEVTGFRVLGVKENGINKVMVVREIERVMKKEPARLQRFYDSRVSLQSNLSSVIEKRIKTLDVFENA